MGKLEHRRQNRRVDMVVVEVVEVKVDSNNLDKLECKRCNIVLDMAMVVVVVNQVALVVLEVQEDLVVPVVLVGR